MFSCYVRMWMCIRLLWPRWRFGPRTWARVCTSSSCVSSRCAHLVRFCLCVCVCVCMCVCVCVCHKSHICSHYTYTLNDEYTRSEHEHICMIRTHMCDTNTCSICIMRTNNIFVLTAWTQITYLFLLHARKLHNCSHYTYTCHMNKICMMRTRVW